MLSWATTASAENPALEKPSQNGDANAQDSDQSDELDSLLDMDLDSLSQAQVNVVDSAPTFSDPIVEGISKTAEKASKAPGIVDVITAEEIESYGAKNLYEVLQRATSVFMTGSFMYPRNVASIRGNLAKHEDNHVLILINGRPFRESTTGGINWAVYTSFPIHMIQRIEVMRGPGSVLYGTNALTGVINIITKQPLTAEEHASTLAGSDGFQRYQLASSHGTETHGLYVGATYLEQEGWPFSAILEDSLRTTGSYGEENIGVFAQYHRNGLSANAFLADATQSSLGAFPAVSVTDSDQWTAFADVGYLWEIDDRQSLQVNFTYNHTTFDTTTYIPVPNPVDYRVLSNGYLVEATYRAKLTDRLHCMIGGLADTHEGNDFSPVLGNAIQPFTETWYGIYLQLDYQPFDWLKIIGGMQGNMPGEIPGGIVPRAGFITSLTDELTCKFLYGQAFRSPYQLERSIFAPPVIQGNSNLRPETIQTFDLQLAYTAENFRFAGTAFYSEIFDSVQRVGTTPQTFENAGRRLFQGFELENDWRLLDYWSWTGSMSYVDNEESGHEGGHSPPWMAKMGIAYHNPDTGLRVGLFDTYFGKPNPVEAPVIINPDQTAYHLVSLNSTLDLNQFFANGAKNSLRLQFFIQNLLDEEIHHIEFEREVINALPAGAGRTYYGGVTLEY